MRKVSPDQVEAVLKRNNIAFDVKSIPYGRQLSFEDGAKLNVYDSRKRNWGGDPDSTSKDAVETLLEEGQVLPQVEVDSNGAAGHQRSNKVFIVYGHDADARNDLELMLRRFRLEPIVLENQTSGGKTIIEKLDSFIKDVHYAIVLLTPDDVGAKATDSPDLRARARQNVVLELGMFLSRLGRDRVAILLTGDVEKPSDIDGLVYIPFADRVQEVATRLAGEMQEAGFEINIKDLVGA